MRLFLQFAVLLATFVALVATSRQTCIAGTPDIQSFEVTGDCGPGGTITIYSTDSCALAVDGGLAVFLPETGYAAAVSPIRGQSLQLSGSVALPDGGTVPLVDGGSRLPASLAENLGCITCPAGNTFSCTGAPDDAGVVTLACARTADNCTATLTPVP